MKLTIGLPSYNNFTEVFFTVQSLRLHHNLTDCEILIIDNFGDPDIEKFVKKQGEGLIRYEKCLGDIGPSGTKNKAFELAKGDMVLCMDSHVLLKPGALDAIQITDNLITGPLMYNDCKNYVLDFKPVWRGHMWGIWGDSVTTLPGEPKEIWGMGCGCFAAKQSSWLGFNPRFKGFGGEEGLIHEKYRKAGRKVICDPRLVWVHMFDRKIPYQVKLIDRVRNYIIGFDELGLDKTEMEQHFGPALINQAKDIISQEKNIIPTTPEVKVNSNKLVSCICLTYGRPHSLEESIHSFLGQDYPNKELIILNDLADQTLIFNHPQVKIFNIKDKIPILGEKRNRAVALSTGEIIMPWDDDDINLPWRISQTVKAFEDNPELGYYKTDKAWCYYGDKLQRPHINLFPMIACFSKKAFDEVGGYNKINYGEDTDLMNRLLAYLPPNRINKVVLPEDQYAFIYDWRHKECHLSALGTAESEKREGLTNLEKAEKIVRSKPIEPIVNLVPHWNEDYLKMSRDILSK